MRRLRILTWHVHGNYLWYLTQVPHDFFLLCDGAGRPGRTGVLPWGDHVHEAPVARLAAMDFDVVLYQSRAAWDDDRVRLLTPAQQRLPRVYLEHDPPQRDPVDQRHWVDDPGTLLVHVTPFNALMWDPGHSPVAVVEHGVKLLREVAWRGHAARGVVVVNHLAQRGRRLGLDVFRRAAARVPLDLYGMAATDAGGRGEVRNDVLPEVLADYRLFFNPIRWTSLGLAIVEAMMIGLPVVALATTELAAVLRDGHTGLVDTREARLHDDMRRLLADRAEAAALGARGRAMARERFHIDRFVADWQRVLRDVAG